MKGFFSTFFMCIMVCGTITFFLAGLILSNIWYLTVFIAFCLALLITFLMGQESKIEELEKKIEDLLDDKLSKDK